MKAIEMSWILGVLLWAVCVGGVLVYQHKLHCERESQYLEQSKQHAAALQAEIVRNQQAFEALMAHCNAGILLLDRNGIIQQANGTACLLFGTTAQTLIGKSLLEATFSKELNRLVGIVREVKLTQRRDVAISGGAFLVVSVSPIQASPGEPARYLLVAHDVTELRRLETIRRDFVANVSHELRTPLASIRAMAETLQDGALHDGLVADRFLGTIVNEAHRLTRISEDLLVLSHAESRATEKTPFLLASLVNGVAERFQPQAQKSQILLEAEVPSGLEVLGNYDQIEQVLVNLIDNAIKYTPEGGHVCVSAERRPGEVAISVRDTGIGIMREDVPRIFERFYRVDKARSRQSGGTGLGLSIVKHIVETHGGQVTVESKYNHGSTFTFVLPNGNAISKAQVSAGIDVLSER